ncbi:FAD-dependent oxidoreductase (plasmid) [Mesorhizobium atlanticum]
MRDTAFKRVLSRLQTGDKVLLQILLDVPHGAFALHEDPSRPAVFLVGGIGIVPAFSMIKDAVERKLPHRLVLLYSTRRPEDAVYLRELQELAEKNPSFKLVVIMTEVARSERSWTRETGRITRPMLAKHVDDRLRPVYYVSGLPEMVSAMKTMLGVSGVSEDDVQAEEFTGFNLNGISSVAGHRWRRYVPVATIALAVTAAVGLHCRRRGLDISLRPRLGGKPHLVSDDRNYSHSCDLQDQVFCRSAPVGAFWPARL